MISDLENKLRLALYKEINDESQVVYILSRIRKIIEAKPEIRGKYKLLNVYCNWTLHTQIDRTKDVKEMIEEFVNNADARHNFLYFNEFKEHFKKFANNILNIDLSEEYLNKFVRILTDVISDTPISIKQSKIITVTVNPSELPRQSDQVTYKITSHDD